MIDWKSLPEGREKYQAYLASPEWAVKKRAARARSGGTCENCQHDPATELHHMTYIRKYNEPLTDLLDVCHPCHQFLSGLSKENPKDYWKDREPVAPYQFVVQMDCDSHVECPKCKGGWNCVHMGSHPTRKDAGKSDILTVPFYCECGCEFSWMLTTRKGYTTIDMEVTGSSLPR